MAADKERALRLVAEAHDRREKAKAELLEAVDAAHAAGCSLREIGKALGMTHAAVRKMLHRKD